jgi:hypothetical protein
MPIETIPCPVIPCTTGKNFHFFGYYDKSTFDASGRFLLGLEVPPIKRYMKPEDTVTIGMIDLKENYKFIPLTQTTAWNWQQGAQAAWLDRFEDGHWIIYNARKSDGNGYESKLLNTRTHEQRSLPLAKYSVTPDHRFALCLNFKRLRYTHPTIGYAETGEVSRPSDHPSDDGLFKMDLQTGEVRLIVDLESTVQLGHDPSMDGAVHWFTHPVPNPSGTRVVFLHRYSHDYRIKRNWSCRLVSADIEGGNVYILDTSVSPFAPSSSGSASIKDMPPRSIGHPYWFDDEHAMAWGYRPGGSHYHIYTDKTDKVAILGEDCLTENGHYSFCQANHDWMLSDTYPNSKNIQTLFLFQVSTGIRINIAEFYHDPSLIRRCRCDLHPRWSRDGKMVCVDSTMHGDRQMYLVDVTSITHV